MKEATGELNMTLVVVIAVATLVTFLYSVIWPSIRNNMDSSTNCNKAICESESNGDGTVNCHMIDANGNRTGSDFTCVWKG